jgi:hypothetical protein
MSYKSELEDHYRAVKARLNGSGLVLREQPKLLAAPSIGGLSSPTGVSSPEASRRATNSFLIRPKRVTASSAIRRIEIEALEAPKLPPLYDGVSEIGEVSMWRRLVAAVAQLHGIKAADILSEKRSAHIIEARMECMYRMRVDLMMSYLNIASKLGRDHSTVIHGVKKVKRRLLDACRETAHSEVAGASLLQPTSAHTNPELVVA